MTIREKMSRIMLPFRRFRQLRWRLTLSYTAVTVGALLIIEMLLIVLLIILIDFITNSAILPQAFEDELSVEIVPDLRSALSQDPPDIARIQHVLAQYGEDAVIETGSTQVNFGSTANDTTAVWTFVLAPDGTLLATGGNNIPGNMVGEPFDASIIGSLSGPVQAALKGVRELDERYVFDEDRMIIVMPIFDEAGMDLLGVLGFVIPVPLSMREIIMQMLPVIAGSLLVFTMGAGLVGTVFGFLTSRGLIRRIDHISDATDAWSQGDFSVFVRDNSGDELSQLARRMNLMAEQLQNLLETRNRLAILEERNRLARDLHDSAKQQAFAASAQIGAARGLLRQDTDATERRLAEADELIYALRQELTALIAELRPAALEEKGLVRALRDYVESWSQREAIDVNIRVQGERSVLLEIEQALFRISQEALANVARHSDAGHVEICLVYESQQVTLTIKDDGKGFDPNRVTAGFGLQSIQDRAASLPGGKLTISTGPGQGTRLSVTSSLARQSVR